MILNRNDFVGIPLLSGARVLADAGVVLSISDYEFLILSSVLSLVLSLVLFISR